MFEVDLEQLNILTILVYNINKYNMDIINILLIIGASEPQTLETFPDKTVILYALSKTGSIRTYEIVVSHKGDHATMTTRKRVTLNGKWTEDVYEYWTGVNIGKSNETTFYEQALSEAASLENRLLDSGFTYEIPHPSKKFNTDANGKLKPMLASPYDETKIVFPCLCQPKYDGVRCIVSKDSSGVHIISRKGKPYEIPHLQKWAEENSHLLPLDGELYNHKELTFQQILSAVKKVSPITEKIKYHVYDRPVSGVPCIDRWKSLLKDIMYLPEDSPVRYSDWVYCECLEDVMKYHKECVEKGYEGVIVRNYEGEYEFGFRSSNLIKVKDFDEEEFEIVDVVEATGRDVGTAVFVCEGPGGIFNSKPQGTREQRAQYLSDREILIGKFVTIQYQGLTDMGIPRFPSAKAVRDYE